MALTISTTDINQYSIGCWENITRITWCNPPLRPDILSNFPNLKVLHCTSAGTAFGPRSLSKRLESLEGLKGCPNLEELDVSHNDLTSLTGLEYCPKLKILKCSSNKLTSMHIGFAVKALIELDCSHNDLTSLYGCESFPNLEKLDCSFNHLVTLLGVSPRAVWMNNWSYGWLFGLKGISSCPALRFLQCSNNKLLNLRGICTELTELDCGHNGLSEVREISICSGLQRLACSSNKITSIGMISPVDGLMHLDCKMNLLASLEGIGIFSSLEELDCADNQIASLDAMYDCLNIRKLVCSNNMITSLQGLEGAIGLEGLHCRGNPIVSIQPLFHLRNIRIPSLSFPDEVIFALPLRVIDFIDGLLRNIRPQRRTIYDDGNNVHDSHIQKSVSTSIQNLLLDPEPNFAVEQLAGSGLSNRTIRLLTEFSTDLTLHSVHGIAYGILLGYVWQRICRSEHKEEMLKVLAEQVLESRGRCFTGRFNRVLSVLEGFYDDIVIEISDNSRIAGIIIAIQKRLESQASYDPFVHKHIAEQRLLRAGYTEAVIEPWLAAIDTDDDDLELEYANEIQFFTSLFNGV